MCGKIKIRPFLGVFKGCESTGNISLRPIFFLSPLANLQALVVHYCRVTDHPRITDMCRYPQVFASTYYYYYIKCIPVSEIVQSAVQNAPKNILIGPVFI